MAKHGMETVEEAEEAEAMVQAKCRRAAFLRRWRGWLEEIDGVRLRGTRSWTCVTSSAVACL
jgi:hypothetical protein